MMAGMISQDARVALAYGPKAGDVSRWPHAHAAHSAALEGTKVWSFLAWKSHFVASSSFLEDQLFPDKTRHRQQCVM